MLDYFSGQDVSDLLSKETNRTPGEQAKIPEPLEQKHTDPKTLSQSLWGAEGLSAAGPGFPGSPVGGAGRDSALETLVLWMRIVTLASHSLSSSPRFSWGSLVR